MDVLKNKLFSINQVIQLSGVSEFKLRAWELRYNCFKPKRTKTNRRLYTEYDLFKAKTLLELTNNYGYKISKIAHHSLVELERLKNTNQDDPNNKPRSLRIIDNPFNYSQLEQILRIRNFKKPLEHIYNVILPLIQEMNAAVESGKFSVAEEHIVSSAIKTTLAQYQLFLKKPHAKHRFLLACPEGDLHEIGLQIAHVFIRYFKIEVIYLGPNTPLIDLCRTALKHKVTHILINNTVSTHEGCKENILKIVAELDKNLPKSTTLLFAGRTIENKKFSLQRTVVVLKNFREFESYLKTLV